MKSIASSAEEDEVESYPLNELLDRVWCGALARRFARAAGLDELGSLAVGTAASELASNAVRHGGGGRVRLRVLRSPRPAIELLVSDDGPGIENVAFALQDGVSKGQRLQPDTPRVGLGAGLGAVARLMDEFSIESNFEEGTRVTAVKWLPSVPQRRV